VIYYTKGCFFKVLSGIEPDKTLPSIDDLWLNIARSLTSQKYLLLDFRKLYRIILDYSIEEPFLLSWIKCRV